MMYQRRRSRVMALATLLLLFSIVGCRAAVAPVRAPRVVAEDPPLSIADSVRVLLLAASRAVVDSALASAPDTAPACVSVVRAAIHYRLALAELRQLAESRRRYISRAQCPRTYTSTIARIDSLGRPVDRPPPGYVDPHYLELALPGRWTNDRLDFDLAISQGTRTDTYLCFTRFRAGKPVVACRHISTSMS
jgi:hypothetical protein